MLNLYETSYISIDLPLLKTWYLTSQKYNILVQCPLDIAALDLAAALPITTSTPVTDIRHYINSNLVNNGLKFWPLLSKLRPLLVAISSERSL